MTKFLTVLKYNKKFDEKGLFLIQKKVKISYICIVMVAAVHRFCLYIGRNMLHGYNVFFTSFSWTDKNGLKIDASGPT